MLPSLPPGVEILYAPDAYQKSPPQVNDIVVIDHPYDQKLILVKRVTRVASNGNCFLTGDNPAASTDSRHWGLVSRHKILGKVTNLFV